MYSFILRVKRCIPCVCAVIVLVFLALSGTSIIETLWRMNAHGIGVLVESVHDMNALQENTHGNAPQVNIEPDKPVEQKIWSYEERKRQKESLVQIPVGSHDTAKRPTAEEIYDICGKSEAFNSKFYQLANHNIHVNPPNYNWGNMMSPYWHGRAIAYFSGLSFSSTKLRTNQWMGLLPTNVQSLDFWNMTIIREICEPGQCLSWTFPHSCYGAWSRIRHIIRSETHIAIQKWLEKTGNQPQEFNATDAVVYQRCSESGLCGESFFNYDGWSYFNHMPSFVTRIFVVTVKPDKHSSCTKLRCDLLDYLRDKFPKVEIIPVHGDIWEDYFRNVYAPVLFGSGTGGSSFFLWSSLANYGDVYTGGLQACLVDGDPYLSPHFERSLTCKTPCEKNLLYFDPFPDCYYNFQHLCSKNHLGQDWHWILVPSLYPRNTALNYQCESWCERGVVPEKVINWLLAH